jgi:hypothetical protein
MTLNVGLSKKLGQPDYGSLGASCSVTVELDATLLRDDLDAFHEQTRKAFVACRQAVHDELARHPSGESSGHCDTPTSRAASGPNGNGSNGNGRANGNAAHTASAKQLDYINQLARQIRGLGIRRVESLAQRMFGKPLAGLSSLDASGLIDTLKSIKVGEIDLNDVLDEATT